MKSAIDAPEVKTRLKTAVTSSSKTLRVSDKSLAAGRVELNY